MSRSVLILACVLLAALLLADGGRSHLTPTVLAGFAVGCLGLAWLIRYVYVGLFRR